MFSTRGVGYGEPGWTALRQVLKKQPALADVAKYEARQTMVTLTRPATRGDRTDQQYVHAHPRETSTRHSVAAHI
jgi:hypothetical protein